MFELNVTVELTLPPAVRVTFAGLKVIVKPVGALIDESLTVPAKPFKLVTVTTAVADEPALKMIGFRFIERE